MNKIFEKPSIGINLTQHTAFQLWALTDRFNKLLLVDYYEKPLNRVEGFAYISTIVLLCLKEYKYIANFDEIEIKYIETLYYEFVSLPQNEDVDVDEVLDKCELFYTNRTLMYQQELYKFFVPSSDADNLPYLSAYLLFLRPLTSGNFIPKDFIVDMKEMVEAHLENISYLISHIEEDLGLTIEILNR